jgi:hypothetical protein
MADFAGRRNDRCPGRESIVYWVKPVLAFAVLFLIVLAGSAPFAEAQTAHFSGGQTTVVSGLDDPEGVAVDGSGNVYIANPLTDQVFKETLSSGTYTQSTVNSSVIEPGGVAVDGNGNVYIADALNDQVLKETPSGFP